MLDADGVDLAVLFTFISSLLKKQREICAKLLEDGCEADGYHYCDYPDKKQTEILNAPEPE